MENNFKSEIEKENLISNIFDKIEKIYKNFIICKKKLIKKYNLTPAETKVLEYIYKNKYCNQMSIAKELNINKSRVSRILDSLILKNYIKKNSSIKDKRIFCLKLTEIGEDIFVKNNNICNDFIKSVFNDLDQNKLKQLDLCLNELLTILKNNDKKTTNN